MTPQAVVEALTGFGNVVVLGVLSVWLAVWIALRVGSGAARAWLFTVAATGIATAIPKIWFGACGYAPWHIHSPSGHSSFSAIAYGGLAVVLCVGESPARKTVIALLAALWIGLIGWSRVVVHAHTPEEVLAGLAIGTLGVMLFASLYGAMRRPGAVWGIPAAMLVFVVASLPQMHLTLEPWLHWLSGWAMHETPICRIG